MRWSSYATVVFYYTLKNDVYFRWLFLMALNHIYSSMALENEILLVILENDENKQSHSFFK